MTSSCADRRAARWVVLLLAGWFCTAACIAIARADSATNHAEASRALWPEQASARLVRALEVEWGVEASRLHVTWAPAEGVKAPAEGAPLHIAGRGRDGWIVVVFGAPEGAALAVRARVAVDESVLVATHDLAPGLKLTDADLRRQLRPRWGPPVTNAPVAPAAGWVTRRALAAGETVAWPAALPPAAVHDGESVEARWERAGVRVSTRATALEAAAEGARVRVRLADGSVCRDARVIGAGVVAIQPEARP